MEIGILTYYEIYNHGAILQANALKTILESFNCNVSFLTFQRNYDMISEWESKKFRLGLTSIPFYIKYAINKGIKNISFIYKKKKIFDKFRREHFNIGKRYSDFEGDMVIIGSDEVFAIDIGVNPFFYGHGIRSKKIISYAGSFGKTTKVDIENANLTNLVRSGFEMLDNISVRDQNSYDLVKSYGFLPTLVCDPVILYGYQKEQVEYVPKLKSYIVVYAYDKNMNDSQETLEIRTYAKTKGLKIYSIGGYHKWCDKNINCTPIELLGYIKHSNLVVTDTFHGSVMSIITNTEFVVRVRDNQNKLRNLLNEYNLTNRIWSEDNSIQSITNQKIDYQKVNISIDKNRKNAMNFLKGVIQFESRDGTNL